MNSIINLDLISEDTDIIKNNLKINLHDQGFEPWRFYNHVILSHTP